MPAAKHRQATGAEMEGIMAVRARPSAAPVAKNGKMYPQRYPAATVNEMATNLPQQQRCKTQKISSQSQTNQWWETRD